MSSSTPLIHPHLLPVSACASFSAAKPIHSILSTLFLL